MSILFLFASSCHSISKRSICDILLTIFGYFNPFPPMLFYFLDTEMYLSSGEKYILYITKNFFRVGKLTKLKSVGFIFYLLTVFGQDIFCRHTSFLLCQFSIEKRNFFPFCFLFPLKQKRYKSSNFKLTIHQLFSNWQFQT